MAVLNILYVIHYRYGIDVLGGNYKRAMDFLKSEQGLGLTDKEIFMDRTTFGWLLQGVAVYTQVWTLTQFHYLDARYAVLSK